MDSQSSQSEWRYCTCWRLGGRIIAFVIALDAFSPIQNVDTAAEIAALSPASIAFRIVIGLGAPAALWLWVRMIIDYFRRRPATHGFAWGVAIFAGLYVVGSYFLAVWRPRNRPIPQLMPPNTTLERTREE
jgi:hypothetical protein